MATLKTRDIKASLKRKGFEPREGDHEFLMYCVNGRRTRIYTKISHGKSEISDPLIGAMSKQVHLKKEEFIDLINCPLTKEKYLELMINRKFV